MIRQKLIEYCLTYPDSYEDYPFDDSIDADAWTVMRHKTNTKSFALIYERNGKLCVNLKCDPFEADFLRKAYKDVTPGWHMNKELKFMIRAYPIIAKCTKKIYNNVEVKKKTEQR